MTHLTLVQMIPIIGRHQERHASQEEREGIMEGKEPGGRPPEGVSVRQRHGVGTPRRQSGHSRAGRRVAREVRRVVRRRAGRLLAAAAGEDRQASTLPMKFLLDTDTCIYARKQERPGLAQLLARSRADIAVSVITEAELRTGAAKSSAAAKTARLIENFLRPLAIVEFTSSDAAAYAHVRARLERPARPSGHSTRRSLLRLSPASSHSS